jgi:hypothetical protein
LGPSALAALVASSLLAAASASAGSTAIDYPDFSSLAGLTLNGNAAQSGSALSLAANTPLQHGSVWAQTSIDTSKSFESRFRAEAHDGSLPPADGMTFTLQSQGLSALGDTGGAHGYAGPGAIAPSVAVDVSLFPQILNGLTEQFSIVQNGSLVAPLSKAASPALLCGQPFWAWVDYDAKRHSLQVFVSQTAAQPAAPLVSATVDLAATVGATAYAGFTAGTGGLDANFDLLGWTVEASGDTTPPTVSCSATPNVLWPPTNKLVAVTTQVTVLDRIPSPQSSPSSRSRRTRATSPPRARAGRRVQRTRAPTYRPPGKAPATGASTRSRASPRTTPVHGELPSHRHRPARPGQAIDDRGEARGGGACLNRLPLTVTAATFTLSQRSARGKDRGPPPV